MTCSRHTSQVNAAAYNADGTYIVTASGDNTAIVWDAKKGTPLHTLQGHTDSVISAAFSPNGERVVTGSYDRTADLDVKTGSPADAPGSHGRYSCRVIQPRRIENRHWQLGSDSASLGCEVWGQTPHSQRPYERHHVGVVQPGWEPYLDWFSWTRCEGVVRGPSVRRAYFSEDTPSVSQGPRSGPMDCES